MLFDLAQTSKASHKEVRTIIRKLRSSQNSAVCLEKDLSGRGGRSPLLLCQPEQSRVAARPQFFN
jgi:hypothetical protein